MIKSSSFIAFQPHSAFLGIAWMDRVLAVCSVLLELRTGSATVLQ